MEKDAPLTWVMITEELDYQSRGKNPSILVKLVREMLLLVHLFETSKHRPVRTKEDLKSIGDFAGYSNPLLYLGIQGYKSWSHIQSKASTTGMQDI